MAKTITPVELYRSLSRDGLTALAAKAGICRGYCYQILTGRRAGSLATLQAITDATGGRVEFIKRRAK